MEVIFHNGCYCVSLDNEELMRLDSFVVEDDVLLSTKDPPYNPPTGRKLRLMVDDTLDQRVAQNFYPADAGWDELELVTVRMSRASYEHLYFSEPIQSEYPATPNDLLITA